MREYQTHVYFRTTHPAYFAQLIQTNVKGYFISKKKIKHKTDCLLIYALRM